MTSGAAALGKTATHGRRHPGAVDIAGWRARPVEIAWCVRFLGRLVLWSPCGLTLRFFVFLFQMTIVHSPVLNWETLVRLHISMRKNT